MENYKGGLVSSSKEDRMSNLPEHLIHSILERLSIKEAVSTSIISKNWRYKWTKMTALVFDKQFTKKFRRNGAFGRNGFIRIINKVLILHTGSILKFHLHIPYMPLDSFQEVDQFIILLSRKGIRELSLTSSDQRYELSSHLFSCLALTKLELDNCFFKLPLEFEGFPNLEELSLDEIDFGANMCGNEISLPQLKTLSLCDCTNLHNFNIKTTQLHSLFVYDCPDAMLLWLLDSPCLHTIHLGGPMEYLLQVEQMNLVSMLSSMPKVTTFSADNDFLKFLVTEKIPKWLPHMVNSLKHMELEFIELGDLDQLHGALCLLRNSPNLETLSMYIHMEPLVDVGPASNHLESPNCLDWTFNLLQTVAIRSIKGSRPELLFIKLLLAHSPSLEKFYITPSRACNVKKRLDIAKDVMQFPRASTKAKICV